MWPFSRSRPESAQPAPAAPETRALGDELLALFGAVPAASGISITPATAMRCAPVRAAVEAIAEGIGGLPLILYQRGEDGARDRANDHPAYALLHDQANDWTPAALFREQATRDACLFGNAFAHIGRDATGTPRELLRLDPATVTVERDPASGEPLYCLATGQPGTPRVLDRRDLIHLQAPSVDGIKGASPVQQCREAIGVALAMERYAANLFGNGGRPSGLLTFPNKLTAEAAQRMRASWKAATSGANAGSTAVLEEDGKFIPLAFSSTDAQFLELWQHAITEIARIFRVPPHLIFELGRATWGNAGEMGATFLRFTLMRWIKAWEGEIRLKLLRPDERATFYAEFLVDDLLRADLGARATAYSQLIAARVLNPNEVRAMENRAPYPGGDEFLNPNTTTGTTPAKPDPKEGDE